MGLKAHGKCVKQTTELKSTRVFSFKDFYFIIINTTQVFTHAELIHLNVLQCIAYTTLHPMVFLNNNES